MAENYFETPDQNLADIRGYDAYETKRAAFRRSMTPDDALQLANFARYHFDPSPELAASVAVSRQEWDNPLMAEIGYEDAKAQDKNWLERNVWRPLKTTARVAALGAEGLWEESIYGAGGRTAIRMSEGLDPVEAWKASGSSDAALAAGQALQGEEVNLGEGFLPKSTLAHETPGYADSVAEGTRTRVDAGMDPQVAHGLAQDDVTQQTYGEIGQPLTQIGRASREAPKMSKVVNGKRYESSWSLGRWGAMQVFQPETIPFNIISGSIDAAARVGFDPLNIPANEMAAAYKSSKLLLPAEVGRDMVQNRKWRPWVKAKTVDEWFGSPGGNKIIDSFAAEPSFRKIRRFLGDIPEGDKLQVARSTDPDEIREILKPWLGGPAMRTKPTRSVGYARRTGQMLGSVVHDKVISRFLPEENIASAWGKRVLAKTRRVGAKSGEAVFTPHDPDRSIEIADQYLRTMEVSPERTDEILSFMAANDVGDHVLTQSRAYGMISGEVESRLSRSIKDGGLGYNAEDVTELMLQWNDAQATNKQYLENLVGDPIKMEGGITVEFVAPDGSKYNVVMESAHTEAEFASHMTALPNMRDARRITSKGRAQAYSFRDKLNLHFPGRDVKLKGMAAGVVTEKLDVFQAVWKNAVLLRGGWPIRVLSEELIRMQGSGYSQLMRDPLSYFALALRNPEIVDITVGAKNLQEVFEEMGGLGAGGFQSNIENLPKVQGPGQNLTRQNWTPINVVDNAGRVTPEGAEALASMLKMFRGSRLRQVVAGRGVEDALRWLIDTPEGREIVEGVLVEAPNVPGWRIADENVLRSRLQSIEFDLGIHMGGDGFYIQENELGRRVWRNAVGEEVDDVMAWSAEAQKQYLLDNDIGGRSYATNKESRAALIWEHKGQPNFNELNTEGRQFFTSNLGDDGLRRLVAYGDEAADTAVPAAVAVDPEEALRIEAVSKKYEGFSVEEMRAEWARLLNEGKIDEAAELTQLGPSRIGDDIHAMDVPAPSSGNRFDDASRNAKEGNKFREWVKNYYDEAEFVTPQRLKSTSVTLEERKAGYGERTIDAVFRGIMTGPTTRAIRGPFATLRYTEEAAIASLWAPPEVVTKLKKWAAENGMSQYFADFTRKAMKDRGLKARPKIEPGTAFSFDDIDQWAKTIAVDDTKRLFFNIAERGNWSDMSRFMAPFSEAFAEVVSRWSDMLGIKSVTGVGKFKIGNPGQAIRNWERTRQVMEGGRRTGFFSEDQFGNESFFMPSIGNMFPGLDQWTGETSIESMMFLDPSLRGLGLPGSSAYVQTAGAFLIPLLPKLPLIGDQIHDIAEDVAYGGFPAPESTLGGVVEAFFPTWGKRLDKMLKSPEQRGQNADNVLQAFTVMMQLRAQNGEPEPDETTRDQMLKDAQKAGTTLSVLQFVEAFLLPASPNYQPGLLVQDMQKTGAPEFWLSAVALNEEYRIAKEQFGDDEAAMAYMLQRFDVDPLKLQSKTHSVVRLPTDEPRFDWMQANPEATQFAPTTMIGLIPVPEGEEFYSEAWAHSVAKGAVQYKTPELGARMMNAQLGDRQWAYVRDEYDQELAEASYRYGPDSDGYRVRKKELDDWKDIEQKNIETVFFDWGAGIQPDAPNVWGAKERPTYGTQYEELMQFTVEGDARRWLEGENPEMVEFLDWADYLFQTAGASGIAVGEALGRDYDEEWWRRDDPETYGETLTNKRQIKEWVSAGFAQYLDTAELSDANRLNVEWQIEYIFGRMIQGWEYDEVRVLVPADVPIRSSVPLEFDVEEVIEGIDPPVGDDEVDGLQEEVPSYG